MAKPANPIQINSLWLDAEGNVWKVIDKLPFGGITLLDEKRVVFSDTYQYVMRSRIEAGNLSLKAST